MADRLTPFHYRFMVQDISAGQGEAFEVYVPAFQSHHLGGNPMEAMEAYTVYFADEKKRRKKEGIAMPKPDVEKQQKQVPVRMNIELYEQISSLAKQKGTSFNKFVVETLEKISV